MNIANIFGTQIDIDPTRSRQIDVLLMLNKDPCFGELYN